MARPQGSRNVLVRITYDDIGRLAGISGNSAKQYANRGEFDSRSLDSAVTWINARRAAKGLPLIGLPADIASEAEAYSDDDTPEAVGSTPARMEAGCLYYDALLGDYRVNEP